MQMQDSLQNRHKIAIIGSGISGLTCGHYLSKQHDVHLFEANSRLGGHTHTVDVTVDSGTYAIDTGFIVFNDWTYPNFIRLMTQLGVNWQDTAMSFSVKTEGNANRAPLEYNGTSINSLFAQRTNFFRPSFYRMIRDILRFNQQSILVLDPNSNHGVPGETLAQYLDRNHYSKQFKEYYIVPMGAAIWSSSAKQMDEFPVEFFVRFFKNHGMLSVDNRPVWKVIQGGSRSYIRKISAALGSKVHLSSPILAVHRVDRGIELTFRDNQQVQQKAIFDQVIFASHSDETRALWNDADPVETEILSAFDYQANSTVLHTDDSVLPKRKLAWAAWNYWVPNSINDKVAVTYNMNILQSVRSPETFCVSLNMDERINPSRILKRLTYHHPVFTQATVRSQKRWGEISGKNRIHYCGAYWGNGFHEDGVVSGLRVCESFGVKP